MRSLRRQFKKFRWLIIVLVLVLAVVAALALRRNKPQTLPAQALHTVQKRDVERTVTADGHLVGLYSRNVYATVPQARVSEVKVSLGQFVSRDDHLFTLELNGRKVKIKSPDWGTVTQINFGVNDTVMAVTQPMAVITNQTQYRIDINVSENDILELQNNMPARVTFPAVSLDTTYAATVESIEPAPVPNSVTVNYKVTLKPTELPQGARLGLSTDVEIITARAADTLAIPENFLIERERKFYVKKFAWNDAEHTAYTTTEVEITTGLQSDEYVEIKSGINAGEELIDPSYTIQRTSSFF